MKVYFIVDPTGYVKIGKTSGNPSERLFNLQAGNPRQLELAAWLDEDDWYFIPARLRRTEADWHRVMKKTRERREWYRLDYSTLMLIEEIRQRSGQWIRGSSTASP